MVNKVSKLIAAVAMLSAVFSISSANADGGVQFQVLSKIPVGAPTCKIKTHICSTTAYHVYGIATYAQAVADPAGALLPVLLNFSAGTLSKTGGNWFYSVNNNGVDAHAGSPIKISVDFTMGLASPVGIPGMPGV